MLALHHARVASSKVKGLHSVEGDAAIPNPFIFRNRPDDILSGGVCGLFIAEEGLHKLMSDFTNLPAEEVVRLSGGGEEAFLLAESEGGEEFVLGVEGIH